jgi:hypothetical protein
MTSLYYALPLTSLQLSIGTIDILIKSAAVVLGGIWTYLNYVRGRTFHRRLEVEISGSIVNLPSVRAFSGQCRIKNIGLSHVRILQRGTGVSVSTLSLRTSVEGQRQIHEEEFTVMPMFAEQDWIEPGEPITDTFMVLLPDVSDLLLGIKVHVFVSNGKSIWSAVRIVETSDIPQT